MQPIPASARRALTVVALAATLATLHVTFAAASAKSQLPRLPASSAQSAPVDADRQLTASARLPENCYLETRSERTPSGTVVTSLVQECD